MNAVNQNHLLFSELPFESKQALYVYRNEVESNTMEEVEKLYQGRTFTLEFISMEEAKKRCMEQFADWGWECQTFDDYHRIYVGDGSDIPNHGDSMYPVIESGDEEWLEDGWHRFHSYVKYDKKEVPVLRIHG